VSVSTDFFVGKFFYFLFFIFFSFEDLRCLERRLPFLHSLWIFGLQVISLEILV